MSFRAKQKLVLAWVDNSGVELTGRYQDRLRQYPETRARPEARACIFGDSSPELLQRLKAHVEREARDHVWMGFFTLDDTSEVLQVARERALLAATSSVPSEHGDPR